MYGEFKGTLPYLQCTLFCLLIKSSFYQAKRIHSLKITEVYNIKKIYIKRYMQHAVIDLNLHIVYMYYLRLQLFDSGDTCMYYYYIDDMY